MGERRCPGQQRTFVRMAWIGGLLASALAPRAARAQQPSTTLTVTGAPSVSAPAIADYAAGFICAGSITASLTKVTGGTFSDAILIRLAQSTAIQSSSPTGFTLPLTDFQYSVSTPPLGTNCTSGTWVSVPAAGATSATVAAAATVPYSKTIYFRLKLAWTTDRGGVTYTLPTVNVYVNSP